MSLEYYKEIFFCAMLVITFSISSRSVAFEPCAEKMKNPLRYVDVFDGAPEELATLIPDSYDDFSGYWQLDYIYTVGRFVTVRCKYKNGESVDVKIPQKISQCQYNADKNQTLKIICQ